VTADTRLFYRYESNSVLCHPAESENVIFFYSFFAR